MADPADGSAASGGRIVEVPLHRLDRWLAGFAERHGHAGVHAAAAPEGWVVDGADGATARVDRPGWVDLLAPGEAGADPVDGRATGAGPAESLSSLALIRPPYGVVLIRRAGYAVASFRGWDPVERKVGRRHIHGRTAAGGWSQQRYARRRDNQADEIVEAAAAAADRIIGRIGPHALHPRFLVTGGDRPLVAAVMQRVARPVAELPVGAHVGVGTPDAVVLAGIPDRVLAVRIHVTDPEAG